MKNAKSNLLFSNSFKILYALIMLNIISLSKAKSQVFVGFSRNEVLKYFETNFEEKNNVKVFDSIVKIRSNKYYKNSNDTLGYLKYDTLSYIKSKI